MSPVATKSHLAGAFAPAKLRKDALRLGLVAAVSILYGVTLEQPVLDVLLIALNAFGAFVAVIAVVFAAFGVRRHGRSAAIALGVYGACAVAHLAAIILLLRH
jgi:hypothetical protein